MDSAKWPLANAPVAAARRKLQAVKCNDKYQRLKKIFEKHEGEFEKELGDRKLFRLYEELLSDYMAMEHEMAVSVYLLGAEDREKMLR